MISLVATSHQIVKFGLCEWGIVALQTLETYTEGNTRFRHYFYHQIIQVFKVTSGRQHVLGKKPSYRVTTWIQPQKTFNILSWFVL